MALTQINRPDSQKALFGTGSDLEIYHDGSHSYIDHSGTGSLFIKGDAATTLQTDTFTVKNYGGSETFLVGTGNGSIELYYNNEKTLQTTASGAEVFNQDGSAVLSIIGNEGNAAQLYLKSDDGDDNADIWRMHADASGNLLIENYASGSYESNIKCVGNGTVELYYDASKKFETTSDGATATGHLKINDASSSARIYLASGDSSDASIYFGSQNDSATGAIRYDHGDDSLRLYGYNNTERLRITSAGDINIPVDGDMLQFGAGQDLQLYSSGSIGHIKAPNDDLRIQVPRLTISNVAADETMIDAYQDGAVELYHNNVKKLETTSAGTTVTGYQLQTAVPAFRAGRQASALSVDAGDAIIFDVTNMGGGFNQGSHYNTSTGRFTAPVAGVYHFHACVIYQDLGTGGTVDMEDVFKVYVNSTQISFAERRAKYTVDGTGSSGYYTDHFSLTTSLSANDYIWLRQDKDSRVIHNNNTYSHFSGHLVG